MLQSRLNRFLPRLAYPVVAITVVTIAATAAADDPFDVPADIVKSDLEYFPPPSEVEQRYAAALESRITVTFDETPLTDVLTTLSELADVPVKFDAILEAELQDGSGTLSGEFTDVPLSAVLARISFEPEVFEVLAKPVWYPAADGIILTIREYELYGGMNAVMRIYPVGDLCESQEQADQLIDLLKSSTGAYWKTTSHDGVSGLLINGALYTTNHDNDIYEMMVYAGSISYVAGVDGLVVKVGLATHAEILELLRMLRLAKQTMTTRAQPIPTAAARQPGNPDSDPAAAPDFTFTVPFTQ